MTNRGLKQRRMLTYFIEAAQDIMSKDGISNITLRKVADAVGYNSATLYNYFQDLDEVVLFASLKYLSIYNLDILETSKEAPSDYDMFFIMWNSFCQTSFTYPEAFHQIFFNKHSHSLDELCQRYYELFPDELAEFDGTLHSIFSSFRLEERNRIALLRLLKSKDMPLVNIDTMNDLMIASYHTLLLTCISEKDLTDVTHYKEQMLTYISFILGICK